MELSALRKISYGLYVVASSLNGKLNGQIANSVFQVTAIPPRIVACIHKQNLTHEYISKSREFSVSVLEKDTPLKVIGLFGFRSGRDVDKFRETRYKTGLTKAPLLMENTLAHIEAQVISEHDVGTHTLFIGEVLDARVVKEGVPLTYSYYRDVKGGKVPKTATVYTEEM